MTCFTHRRYFQRYQLNVAQYGEILAAQAFRGKKMGDSQKCFDILASGAQFRNALREVPLNNVFQAAIGEEVRIQVRSKLSETPGGRASVVNCKETDLPGMTHLVVILVNPGTRVANGSDGDEGFIVNAWLMTSKTAAELRQKEGKIQYIRVHQLMQASPVSGVLEIADLLRAEAEKPLESSEAVRSAPF